MGKVLTASANGDWTALANGAGIWLEDDEGQVVDRLNIRRVWEDQQLVVDGRFLFHLCEDGRLWLLSRDPTLGATYALTAIETAAR